MYRVLVVDDEKLERDGIRFLLSMEEGEWEIYEAANGKLALNELRKHPVDLMLTDIKMPHMDGLELSKKAREEYPDLEIIIFSGYGDFAFAQEAIRYGVTDYVLKPVDPDRFHDTIQKIQKEIASRKNKEQQSIKEKSFLQQYFLLGYIYSGDQERLKEAEGIVDFSVWEQWHCAILIESDEAFFDSASDEVPLEIREELRRSFFYLNLNGRQSLLLFKDDGLELSKKAREEYPDLEIIIFSGYGDFAFAQEAIRYGVTDYVLKPVDPDRFHDTIQKIQKEIASRKNKEQQSIKEKSFLQQYFLLGYIYSGDQERLKEAEGIVDFSVWEQWHCAILIESDEAFFDSASDEVPLEIREELRRSFFYLNLNGRQSLLLFKDVYCDYVLVAKNVYNLLKRLHPVRFHLAVSRRFDGYQELPEIMEQLEQQMEEKFYHPDIHVYTSEEDEEKNTGEEEQDSRLMEKISEDISRKDVKQLWSHFRSLASKYQSNTQFSAMYVKFVFSNVIRELFQENRFAGEHRLDLEVDHLYGCSTIQEIIEVTEKNIRQYEEFLDRSMSESRDEVAAVKNYIYNHYAEDLNLETLAEKVYLSSGYLSFIFKKETGMNLNRFIRVFRMEKAKELLRTTNMKVAMVSEQVGFANSSYFCRSFREYYGSSPESYRKGNNEDEESSEEV